MNAVPASRKLVVEVYAIPLIVAVCIRVFILYAAHPYFFGGDLYTYIVFSHEIAANAYALPHTNTIHFPGSAWVFPPLIPYIVALLYSGHPIAQLYLLTWIEIFLSSLTVIPLIHLSRKVSGEATALVTGLIYATFPGFIYLCLWGDLAQVAALLMFAALLNPLYSILTRPSLKSVTYAVALSILVGITHDLTFFVVVFLEFILLVYALISHFARNSLSRQSLISVVTVFLVGSIVGGIWYFFHYTWIVSTILGGGNFLGTSSSFSSIYNNVMLAIATENGLPYGYFFLSFAIFFLLAISVVYTHHSLKGAKVFLLDALVLIALIPMILVLRDAVLVSRFMYFLYIPYTLFGGVFLYFVLSARTHSRALKPFLYLLKTVAIVGIALYLSFAVIAASTAHSYYIAGHDGTFADEQNISSWIESHIGTNETVAAPQAVGFSLMALGNLPVLVSENTSLLSQQLEINQSEAATTMILDSFNSGSVHYYASLYNIEYIVSNLTLYPAYYSPEYKSGNYTVFQYTG